MRAAFVLTFLICSLSVRAWATFPPCEQSLVETRLGIGVLGRSSLGFPILGIGSYVGSHHDEVIKKMTDKYAVVRLEWLGEMRYTAGQGYVRIYEVNETSGHFSHGTSELPMKNDAQAIPYRWRAAGFVLHTYDPNNPHLDQTLNAVSGNVRHELGNVLQKFSSLISILSSPRFPLETKMELVDQFRSAPEHPLALVEWILDGLVRERVLTEHEIQETRLALHLLSYPGLSTHLLDSGSKMHIADELMRVSRAMDGAETLNRIRIVADYWP